jgi:hypothetical protein
MVRPGSACGPPAQARRPANLRPPAFRQGKPQPQAGRRLMRDDQEDRYQEARRLMVETQIKRRGSQ